MTFDTFTEASHNSLASMIVNIIVMTEYAGCILLNAHLLVRKMTYNLTFFYLFLLLQSFCIEIYFFGYFYDYSKPVRTVMYFASDMFLSTSINFMAYEWLKIVILSKSILFIDKRYLIRKGFYIVGVIMLFLWMAFVASIFLGVWTKAKFVEYWIFRLMVALYIISSFVNFLLVSYIGLKLIKTYALFLESSKYALSRWVYLGIAISLIKMTVPGIFMFDTKIKSFFDYESFSLAFTIINHNFGGILPMLVYHKSFKLSFIILDENRKSQNIIKFHLKNISLIESARSLESLSEDYAMQ